MENLEWQEVFKSPKPVADAMCEQIKDRYPDSKVVAIDVEKYPNYCYAVVEAGDKENIAISIEEFNSDNLERIIFNETKQRPLALWTPGNDTGYVLGEVRIYDESLIDAVKQTINRIEPKTTITHKTSVKRIAF